MWMMINHLLFLVIIAKINERGATENNVMKHVSQKTEYNSKASKNGPRFSFNDIVGDQLDPFVSKYHDTKKFFWDTVKNEPLNKINYWSKDLIASFVGENLKDSRGQLDNARVLTQSKVPIMGRKIQNNDRKPEFHRRQYNNYDDIVAFQPVSGIPAVSDVIINEQRPKYIPIIIRVTEPPHSVKVKVNVNNTVNVKADAIPAVKVGARGHYCASNKNSSEKSSTNHNTEETETKCLSSLALMEKMADTFVERTMSNNNEASKPRKNEQNVYTETPKLETSDNVVFHPVPGFPMPDNNSGLPIYVPVYINVSQPLLKVEVETHVVNNVHKDTENVKSNDKMK